MTSQVLTAGEKVKISAIPIVPELASTEERVDFEVLVRVEAPLVVKNRLPIDIVVLLDVSESMGLAAAPSTKKLTRLDLLKRAMKFVITHLAEEDRLAIVAFNHGVVKEHTTNLFEISGIGRGFAERKMDELVANGKTAFKPALEQAIEILDNPRRDRNRPGFLILLTDGLDNSSFKWNEENVPEADAIRRDILNKYPIHTFGFCAGHDPRALLFIAQASRGTYSFVDDQHLGRITDAFAICLGRLKTVVATNVRVVVSTKATSSMLTQLTNVDWGGFEAAANGGKAGYYSLATTFRTLYAGEVMNFIAHVHLRRAGTYLMGEDFYVEAHYKVSPEAPLGSADGNSSILRIERPAQVVDTGRRQEQVIVQEQIARFKMVESVTGLLSNEFKHLRDIAGIEKDEVKEAMEAQARAASTLETKWVQAQRRGVNLDALGKEIQEMMSSLKRGVGVAHMCSWLSGHQMQRATTMGSPDKVLTQFLTPAAKEMLQESKKHHFELEIEEESAESEASNPELPPPTQVIKPKIPQPEADWSDWRCVYPHPHPAVKVKHESAETAPPLPKIVTDIKNWQCAGRCANECEVPQPMFQADGWMEQRLEAWSILKREARTMFETAEDHHLDAVREASLDSFYRGMHQDIYLAVTRGVSNARRYYFSGDGSTKPPAAKRVGDSLHVKLPHLQE